MLPILALSAGLVLLGCTAPTAALPTQISASPSGDASPTALAGSWFGTLSYPASQKGEWLSHNVPPNFTITVSPTGSLLASADWMVEHYPGGGYCAPQHEEGMNVTVDSSTGRFLAKGLGTGQGC